MENKRKRAWRIRDRIDDQAFMSACLEADSMAAAAADLGLHFNSFKKRAIELGCYEPNQAGIGMRKNKPKVLLDDIIAKGLYPSYQSLKLKKRLLQEGVKPRLCERCQLSTWQGQKIPLELHHRDGDRTNHLLSNLQLLCPNCHSQTENFRGKNK